MAVWVNGKPNEPMVEKLCYQFKMSGFFVRTRQTGPGREANIYIEGTKEVLVLKTYHDFVRVDVQWKGSRNYENSLGLLGSHSMNEARVGCWPRRQDTH